MVQEIFILCFRVYSLLYKCKITMNIDLRACFGQLLNKISSNFHCRYVSSKLAILPKYFINQYKISRATNWKKPTCNRLALLFVLPYKISAQFIQPNFQMKSKCFFFFNNFTNNKLETDGLRGLVMQKAKCNAGSGLYSHLD